jgi:DnaJ-class molecular chaperone
MWQKCPICNGTGKDPLFQEKYCTVCNGYKIINELTGLPPVKNSGFRKMIDPQLDNLHDPK